MMREISSFSSGVTFATERS